jgi:hypothetical protein
MHDVIPSPSPTKVTGLGRGQSMSELARSIHESVHEHVPPTIIEEEDEDIFSASIIAQPLFAPEIPTSGPELTGKEISGSSGHGLSGHSGHGVPNRTARSVSFLSDSEEKGDVMRDDNQYSGYSYDQYLAHDEPSPLIPSMISMNNKHRLLLKSGIEIRSYILSTSMEGTTRQLLERSNPILTAPVPYDPSTDLVAEDLRVTPAVISAIDRYIYP